MHTHFLRRTSRQPRSHLSSPTSTFCSPYHTCNLLPFLISFALAPIFHPTGSCNNNAVTRLSLEPRPSSSSSSLDEEHALQPKRSLPAAELLPSNGERPRRAPKRKAVQDECLPANQQNLQTGRKVQGKRGETEEQDGALQNTVADRGIAAPQNDAAALPEDAAGAALYSCPWPGCDRQFQRVKSRSAHLKWHGGDYTEAAGPAATVASPTEAVSPARVAAAATAAVMPTSGPIGGGEEETSTRRGKRRQSDPLHALADATDHREDVTWLVAGAAVLCRQCAPVDNGGAVRYASGTLLAPVLPAGGAPEPVAWTVRFSGGRGGKRASETAVADIFPDVVPEQQQASVCTARPLVALPGALSGTLGTPDRQVCLQP